MTSSSFVFGHADTAPVSLQLKRANRHGFVAGATGTGKTVTLQTLAQNMALNGVPVFAVDVKGDLSSIALPNESGKSIPQTVFWDIYGESGTPIRTTIAEFGSLLLSRLLGLSDAQAGVLDIVFRLAKDDNMLLLDLKDLTALLNYVAANAQTITQRYGLVATSSIAAIQREILRLEEDGGDLFFGEPALDLKDLLRISTYGFGTINILHAPKLIQHPKLYATLLLWLLAEIFETFPEAGDLDKPKLCLFFDEAHLMFDDAPPVLIDKIENVVRLIRSKGVGVYFVTQNPLDIPENVLAQLGNRFQHALRAYTPKEQKAVKVAAESFRPNDAFNTSEIITQLGIGEALVSTLDEKGVPTIVEKVKIDLPPSILGGLSSEQRQSVLSENPLHGKYASLIDRESAYERLAQKTKATVQNEKTKTKSSSNGNKRQGAGEALVKSILRAAGSQVGRQIGQQILRRLLKR